MVSCAPIPVECLFSTILLPGEPAAPAATVECGKGKQAEERVHAE